MEAKLEGSVMDGEGIGNFPRAIDELYTMGFGLFNSVKAQQPLFPGDEYANLRLSTIAEGRRCLQVAMTLDNARDDNELSKLYY